MKVNRNRSMIPVYRESGYARMLPAVSGAEMIMRLVALLMLVTSVVLLLVARSDSRWTELYYSLGLYPLWAGLVSAITGWIPFSLGEWLLLLFVLCCLVLVVHFVYQLASYKRQLGRVVGRFAIRVLSIFSAVLMIFVLAGGLNYYRYRYADYTGLVVQPSDASELVALCGELVAVANEQRAPLAEAADGTATYRDSSPWRMGATAPESYKALVAGNDSLQPLLRLATTTRPKPIVFSELMSYMQIVGIYLPFTVEANVNVHTTDYTIPAAMCHELAHVAGFMREDEANFIAYTACRASSDSLYRYSGTMLALVHSSNALYSVDRQAYSTVMQGLGEQVRRDMQQDTAYWTKYDTSLGKLSTAVNDGYLKANEQSAGVASYGQMVDLLLADRRQQATQH